MRQGEMWCEEIWLGDNSVMVHGINHITLAVRDLEVSFGFYTDVLGLRPVAKWYRGAYLEAGGDWVCLTLDEATRSESLPEYTHMAFTVNGREFPAAVERLKAAGVESWQENRSPGKSFYFMDPNGHKLEIHASDLGARLKALRENPPKELVLY
jgi:catechol 2,3-dioxygenase-like lactoylglutathione lyase family enzyme